MKAFRDLRDNLPNNVPTPWDMGDKEWPVKKEVLAAGIEELKAEVFQES